MPSGAGPRERSSKIPGIWGFGFRDLGLGFGGVRVLGFGGGGGFGVLGFGIRVLGLVFGRGSRPLNH